MADSYKGEYRAIKRPHDGAAQATGADPTGPQTNGPGPGDKMSKLDRARYPVYKNVGDQKAGG